MTCKDCIHRELCADYVSSLAKVQNADVKYISQWLDEIEGKRNQTDNECEHFADRSRFVELQTAHWIRHSPDKNIMREFHKQGIGRGMGENSIFWTCSNCESWGNLSFKYCPSCGAKIEEAEQFLKELEANE